MSDKVLVVFDAGKNGEYAYYNFGDDRVQYFVDDERAGGTLRGKPILSVRQLRELEEDYAVVVADAEKVSEETMARLGKAGNGVVQTFLETLLAEKKTDPRLTQFKNMYSGKKFVIVGNGPSLRAAHLEALARKNEYVFFASNLIYRIFRETSWRPDLYCSTDHVMMLNHFNTMADIEAKYLFFGAHRLNKKVQELRRSQPERDNVFWFEKVYLEWGEDAMPLFSPDPSKFLVEGSTITFSMIQWAAYMGCSEIYLIGVDWEYPDPTGKNPKVNHFCHDYCDPDIEYNPAPIYVILKSYEKAKEYSKQHGFRIFNATCGGKLEVFERISLDSLLADA